MESAAPEAAAAWVDRSADTPKSETTYQEERRHLLTEDGHEENRLVNAGMTVLSFGLVVLTQVTVTALGILAAPLRFGRRFIPGITPRRG